jgi:hypothetical protein
MGASMPWATALLPYAAFLSREMAGPSDAYAGRSASGRLDYAATSDADDDAATLTIVGSHDAYWATQPVNNTPGKENDSTSNITTTDSLFDASDLGDGITSLTPSAPQAGVSFPSFNEHAITVGSTGPAITAPHTASAPAFAPVVAGAPATISGADLAAGIAAQGAADGFAPAAQPLIHALHSVSPNASRPSGYSPSQIQHAYGFDKLSQTGAGVTIAIVDAYNDPTITSDLHTFDHQFGLADPNFTIAYAQGSKPRNNGGWAQEISIDVEWAHAIAPGASIMLVECASNSNNNLFGGVDYATNHGAQVVSMSWRGGDSSSDTSLDAHFNHSGVCYIASSGDSGGTVGYPSTSPYVISVGGTHLPLDSSGNLTGAETVWSGSGGGPSTVESEPGYQTSYGITITGGKRGTPDVSYDADPNTGVSVYDSTSYQGLSGWITFGGTSIGAPQWAGLIALADQGRATPISSNNLSSTPWYNGATGSLYASDYRDITSGSAGSFSATTGYDLCTGLGSPLANNLVPYLISH